MKFTIALLSAVLASVTCHAQVLTLTGFGTGQFALESGISNLTTSSQSASDFSFTANALGGAAAGTFANFDMTGYMGGIDLWAAVTGTNPNVNFTLTIFSNSGDSENPVFSTDFTGNTASFTSVISQITLSPATPLAAFNPSQVFGVQLTFNGSTGSVSMILDSLTVGAAIPEPSTYAAIFGALALALVAYRRRQIAA